MYIATCGTISNSIAKEISNILQGARNNNQEVVLAFDQDQAGQRLSMITEKIAKASGVYTVQKSVSCGKDWNEQLQQNLSGQTINFLLQLQKTISRNIRSNYSIDDDEQKSKRKNKVYMDKSTGIDL